MKILINGCSHSTGDYFYKEHSEYKSKFDSYTFLRTTWWNYFHKELGIGDKNVHQIHYFLANHSPKSVSEKEIYSPYGKLDTIESLLKYLPRDVEKYIFDDNFLISLANDGKGNDTIFLETFDVLRKIEKNKIDLDFVIIQWSSPIRKLVSDEKNYLFSNPHENYEYGLNFEPAGSLLTLNYMIILQEYLKQKNIKYVFLNYFPLDRMIENSFFYNQLDFSKIVTFHDNHHPIFEGWLSHIISNNFHEDPFGHPNLNGKKYIANRIYNKLKTEYGLKEAILL
jgi:hypothetical protein